jgi:hypothetical protein
MPKTDEILRAALALPQEARAELADKLLLSLDDADQDEIDARWAREAEDRISAFERGEISAIPGDEVFVSLKSRRRA